MGYTNTWTWCRKQGVRKIIQPESITPDDNGNQGSNQGGGDDDLVE
jgi:hypothetical protein